MKRAAPWKVVHTPGGWRMQGPPQQAAEANRFLERTDLRGLAPGSLRTYAYDLLGLLRWAGKRALQNAANEEYFEFVSHCRDRIHPVTINRRLRLLHVGLEFVQFYLTTLDIHQQIDQGCKQRHRQSRRPCRLSSNSTNPRRSQTRMQKVQRKGLASHSSQSQRHSRGKAKVRIHSR